MKLNTLEKLLTVLETEQDAIEISEDTMKKSLLPLDKMLELAK